MTGQKHQLGNALGDTREILLRFHSNLLLSGSERQLTATLEDLKPMLRPPLHEGTAVVPAQLPCRGTVILRDLEATTGEQQRRLMDWLNRYGEDLQVVTVGSDPLFPLVESGQLLDTLFYRLNVVHIVLS